MITLYGFGRIFPEGRGETKDLRAQWALEETGLPYRVHALDHTGGELQPAHELQVDPAKEAGIGLVEVLGTALRGAPFMGCSRACRTAGSAIKSSWTHPRCPASALRA